MAAILQDGELRLSGYVGDYYFEDGFTSADVVTALAQVDAGETLTVHINSGGGVATEGAAIHALLSARSGTTDIVVEGIAASAASLIAMAGDTVTMSAGAVMMIHDPSGMTIGTSADHSKTIEGLEALATAYARVYADKSGKSVNECRTIMKEERWLTPEEAVAEGFADATTGGAKPAPVAAFDYRAYAHAPKRLTALAAKKNWRHPGVDKAATAASTRPTQEQSMTDKTNGGDTTAEIDKAKRDGAATAAQRIKAIMQSAEAKDRAELAEHFAYDTEMTAEAAVAALAKAPKATAAAPTQPATAQQSDEDYEASRAAGAGLGGRATAATAKGGQKVDLVAIMKKQLGQKETV